LKSQKPAPGSTFVPRDTPRRARASMGDADEDARAPALPKPWPTFASVPRARGFRCAHGDAIFRCGACRPAHVEGKSARYGQCFCRCYALRCDGPCRGRWRADSVECMGCGTRGEGEYDDDDGERFACAACGGADYFGALEGAPCRDCKGRVYAAHDDTYHTCTCGHRECRGYCRFSREEGGAPGEPSYLFPCVYCGGERPEWLLQCHYDKTGGMCGPSCWIDMQDAMGKFDEVDGEGDCPICYESRETLIRIACGHTVCKDCWCDATNPHTFGEFSENKCPLCRRPNAPRA